MSVSIITDTSANLPSPLTRELGLTVLPFLYIEQGQEKACLDTEAFNDEAFYAALRQGERVTTSMINAAAYRAVMEPLAAQGEDILYIGMSSGISGAYNAARQTAEELSAEFPERKIVAFDTLGASLGEGLLAVEAAKMNRLGLGLESILERMRSMRQRMRQVFTVDDLMFLQRGGRISRISAVLGSLLQIKPTLYGDSQGKIVVGGKCRGRKAALKALAEDLAAHIQEALDQTVGIAYAGCREEAEALAAMIRRIYEKIEIMLVPYEPVTGSQVGPGTVALFYQGAPNPARG